MARPRTSVATFGKIKITELRKPTRKTPGLYEARCRVRLRNGTFARPRRRGPTETAAENALKEHITRLVDEIKGKKIDSGTRFGHVCDLWLASLERKVEAGTRAPKTLYDYRDTVRNHVKPRLGELTCREVQDDVGLCDEVIKAVQDQVKAAVKKGAKRGETGHAAAKRMRVVLSGICGWAMRQGAMTSNPIKSVETIDAPEKKPIRALTPAERVDFLEKFAAAVKARAEDPKRRLGKRASAWLDLPDLALAGLATGGRIGEVLAIVGDEVDPKTRKVGLSHHLVRVEGVGIVRQPQRKGGKRGLNPTVPSWAMEMFKRRKLASGGGLLFRTVNGELEDPSNVMKRLKVITKEIGYEWVTSHVLFRKTTAKHLGDSDISDARIAGRLGNTEDVVRGHYRPELDDAEAVAVLESMFVVPEEVSTEDEEGDESTG